MKRKKPLNKVRNDSITKLKKKLWLLCRAIAEQRYGTDCYTCGARDLQGSNKQLGHFISSSVCSAAMRYDLDNLRFQCAGCNIWKSGNWLAYEAHLRRDGIDVEELKRRNEQTKGKQYDRLWYENKIAAYTKLL